METSKVATKALSIEILVKNPSTTATTLTYEIIHSKIRILSVQRPRQATSDNHKQVHIIEHVSTA